MSERKPSVVDLGSDRAIMKDVSGGGDWKPYRGPRGGEGWQRVSDPEDVVYDDDPPGEVADGYEEQAEGWGSDSEGDGQSAFPDPENYELYDVDSFRDVKDHEHVFTLDGDGGITSARVVGMGWDEDEGFTSVVVEFENGNEARIPDPDLLSVGEKIDGEGYQPYENVEEGETPTDEQVYDAASRMSEYVEWNTADEFEDFVSESFIRGVESDVMEDAVEEVVGDIGGIYEGKVRQKIRNVLGTALDEHASPESESYRGKIYTGSVDDSFKNDFISEFRRREGNDAYDHVRFGAASGWSTYGRMMSEDTAGLWQVAFGRNYRNDFVAKNEKTIKRTFVDPERKDAIGKFSDYVTEAYREAFGDTVPAFRGVDADNRGELRDAQERARRGQGVGLRQMALTSWSTDPSAAKGFAEGREAVIVRKEIPVENIVMGSDVVGDMYDHEAELVVRNDEEYTDYDGSDLFMPEDFDAVEQARWLRRRLILSGAIDGEPTREPTHDTAKDDGSDRAMDDVVRFDLRPSLNWLRQLHENPGGGDEKSSSGEWKPYLGPNGGEGWQDITDPDDIRYGIAEPPGEVAEGYEEEAEMMTESIEEGSAGADSPGNDGMNVNEVLDVFEEIRRGRLFGDEDGNDYKDVGDAAAHLVQGDETTVETAVTAIFQQKDIDRDEYGSEGRRIAGQIGTSASAHSRFGVNLSLNSENAGYPRRKAISQFSNEIAWGPHVSATVEEGINEWKLGMFEEETASMFQVAADRTGNDTLPTSGRWHEGDDDMFESVMEIGVSHEEKEAIEAKVEQTQDILRETFGDTMTVYRGVSDDTKNPTHAEATDVADKIREAKDRGDAFTHEHRPIESWTTRPEYAGRYARGAGFYTEDAGGVVLEKEVPVERIMAASHTGNLDKYESEIIVMHDEEETYDADQIVRSENVDAEWMIAENLRNASELDELKTIEEREREKADDAVIRVEAGEVDPHWLHRDPPDERRDGENDAEDDTKEKILDGLDTVFKEGQWKPYLGPNDGEGWQNVNDPEEVRYQDDPPGEVADGYEEYAEVWGGESGHRPVEPREEPHEFDDTLMDTSIPLGQQTWRDSLENSPFEHISEIPIGTTVQIDSSKFRRFSLSQDAIEGRVIGYRDMDAEIGEPNALKVLTEDIDEDIDREVTVFPKDFVGFEYPEVDGDEYFLEPFEHANRKLSARDAGITGGNTTGEQMEILDMPDGSRVFATPVDAYDDARTSVVHDGREAMRNNMDSPKVIEQFGGNAARTTTARFDGDVYIVKEGIEGRELSEAQVGGNRMRLRSAENEELLESLHETVAAAYFVGNWDLHGSNIIVNEETQEATVIDHDSAGRGNQGVWYDLRRMTLAPGVDEDRLKEHAYGMAGEYARGEIDVPDDVHEKYTESVQTGTKKIQEQGAFWEQEFEGTVFEPVSGYEDLDDFSVDMEAKIRDEDTGRVRDVRLTDRFDGSWFGETDDGEEVRFDDPREVIEVIEE